MKIERLKRGNSKPEINILDPEPFEADFAKADANPQLGVFPLEAILTGRTSDGHVAGEASIKENFIKQHVITRGRPHFAGLHAMMLNDAIAVVMHSFWNKESYGIASRLVESHAEFDFFHERFIRGSMLENIGLTREVDSWKIIWSCRSSRSSSISLDKSGIIVVEYLGIDGLESILMARGKVFYLRCYAVRNKNGV